MYRFYSSAVVLKFGTFVWLGSKWGLVVGIWYVCTCVTGVYIFSGGVKRFGFGFRCGDLCARGAHVRERGWHLIAVLGSIVRGVWLWGSGTLVRVFRGYTSFLGGGFIL